MTTRITTYAKLEGLIREHGTVYVRWSRSINQDVKRGHSIDWSSRSPEPGISVMLLCTEDLADGPEWITRLLMDYSIARYNGAYCRIVTGDVVGHGGDGEPCLDADTIEALGVIPFDLGCELADWALHEGQRQDATRMKQPYAEDHPLPWAWYKGEVNS